MRLKLIATATFGLEAVVKREIQALGYDIISTENGHVMFWGDERAIARCNLWLRCADRLLLLMGEFSAVTFEELFQQTGGLPWEQLIPPDGRFTVIGTSVKSQLHSVPACQSIVKKAVAQRLGEFYCMEQLPETGAEYRIKIGMMKDRAQLTVDTSGIGLHKRGYRTSDVAAPIKETLAAALIQLSFWNPERILADPCCGSGTIPIEAALIGRNIAPGLSREFASEGWELIRPEIWKEERREAFKAIRSDVSLKILAGDIDRRAIAAARANAEEAGVDDCIVFRHMDVARLQCDDEGGVMITNPPYGRRIGDDREIRRIYKALRAFFRTRPTWSLFLITADKSVERNLFGRKANRRRKLFNGRMEVCYYQFHGKKPEKTSRYSPEERRGEYLEDRD